MRTDREGLDIEQQVAHLRGALTLLTVGHGTLSSGELVGLLEGAGVKQVIDVRSAPGSRRHPHFSRSKMECWLPAAGIGYRWEPELGGFRRPLAGSLNTGLRHASFRGYADYMESISFGVAFERLLDDCSRRRTAVMCAESLWWRCHRRLIADAAVLAGGASVWHLGHEHRLTAHRVTDAVRTVEMAGITRLIYDVGTPGHSRSGSPA